MHLDNGVGWISAAIRAFSHQKRELMTTAKHSPAPSGPGRTPRPRPKRGEGQWALGYTEPLNKNEQTKKDDNPLNVRDRILNIYSKRGFASIDPADLRGRFRWMGLYTQRAQGIPGGKTAVLDAMRVDAAIRSVPVAWGQCADGSVAPAFWPWTTALRGLLAQPRGRHARPVADGELEPLGRSDLRSRRADLLWKHRDGRTRPRGGSHGGRRRCLCLTTMKSAPSVASSGQRKAEGVVCASRRRSSVVSRWLVL